MGTYVRKLEVPGKDLKNIFYLRTLADAKKIIAAVQQARQATVVGGGFVGFEMCDMLKLAGLDVSLVIRENHFWQNSLDKESARLIEVAMEKAGIKIIRQQEVTEIIGSDQVEKIKLTNGQILTSDLVVIGIGCNGHTDWLQQTGIKINHGIVTNEYLETNLPNIWAAGDAAEFKDLILEENVQLGNWLNAQLHGVTAGKNMTGAKEPYRKVTSYTTHGFGLQITYLGDGRLLPDRPVVIRGDKKTGSFSQIIIDQEQIIGAIIFNNPKEQGNLTKLIEQDVIIADKLEQLADLNIPLTDLLPK